MLLWQCYRQSSYLVWCVWLLAVGILLWLPLTYFTAKYFPQGYNDCYSRYFVNIFPWNICIAGFVIFSNIFYGDHRKNAILFLSYRGISPRKVWWSRIVLFGSLLILCLVALNAAYFLDHRFIGILKDYTVIKLIMVWMIIAFAIGQFASIMSRSIVLPMVTTCVGLFLAVWWLFFYLYLINILPSTEDDLELLQPMIFSTPLILAFFIASRMRIYDLMRDRPLRASMKKIVLSFAIPFVLTITAIAIYRLTTIPSVNYGYKLDDWALRQKVDYEANEENYDWGLLMPITNQNNETNAVNKFSDNFDDYKISWKNWCEFIENPLNNPLRVYLGEQIFYDNIRKHLVQDEEVTPKFIKDAIAFLETMPERRVSSETVVQRHYERVYHIIKNNEQITIENPARSRTNVTFYFLLQNLPRVIAPWEKYRALKFVADYRFQVDSLIAEQSENLIYHHRGNAEYLRKKITETRKDIPIKDNQWFFAGFILKDCPVTPYTLFLSEAKRRETLIYLALRFYAMEHGGKLPETLDELKGIYLSEIPLVPFYNVPFEYVPHPTSEDESKLTASSYPAHKKNMPYLLSYYDDTLPGYYEPKSQRMLDIDVRGRAK